MQRFHDVEDEQADLAAFVRSVWRNKSAGIENWPIMKNQLDSI
jgi:hypothetical protein